MLAVTHAVLTYSLVLCGMGWTMFLLDSGVHEAPIGLQVVDALSVVFSLPLLLPLARAALALGFADPVHDVIYFPMPLLNSVAVAWIAVFVPPMLRKRKVAVGRNAV